MYAHADELRRCLEELLQDWRRSGVPSRGQLVDSLEHIIELNDPQTTPGLWSPAPLMLTATLDDGWGHGLEVIERCARAAGLKVERVGLLLSAEQILIRCSNQLPQLLGLTVLQLDSEPSLAAITEKLKGRTQVIVGGPPFQIDPELAARTQVDYVAKNVADFLDFLLHGKIIQR
jgi:methylmalonyl-CoA mutase cobalamin-binding subunit